MSPASEKINVVGCKDRLRIVKILLNLMGYALFDVQRVIEKELFRLKATIMHIVLWDILRR